MAPLLFFFRRKKMAEMEVDESKELNEEKKDDGFLNGLILITHIFLDGILMSFAFRFAMFFSQYCRHIDLF
jgi:hypothetical protein